MKIVVARLNHETNTFSPVSTDRESFAPVLGRDARDEQLAGNTAMTAFIKFAESLPGARVITPLSAMANPSGSVQPQAYDWLCDQIVSQANDTDLFLLDLHGAMVVEGGRDGEGELLERLRRLAPTSKIVVALDLHANVTQKMVDNVDAMASFKTYPHVDMQETGELLTRITQQMLDGTSAPVTAWRQLPLLSHTLRSNTDQGAMQRAVALAKKAEQHNDVLAVSIIAGFSLADFADAGMSVLVVANGNRELAQEVANDIAAQLWSDRDGFVYESAPLHESLQAAQQAAARANGKPVLLLDHSDNVMSGGTCDTLDILARALETGLDSILVGPVCDPAAVQRAMSAGLGASIELEVGNRFARPIPEASPAPLRLQGTVRAISDGKFTVRGPIYTGANLSMGATIAFDIGPALLVITEQRVEPLDLGIFACAGIDPTQYRFILLKSRMYCRPVFGPLCSEMIECDSDIGGPTSSNYRYFRFERLRRPVFPLEAAEHCKT
jgi:microcystin degradation protein MlrC